MKPTAPSRRDFCATCAAVVTAPLAACGFGAPAAGSDGAADDLAASETKGDLARVIAPNDLSPLPLDLRGPRDMAACSGSLSFGPTATLIDGGARYMASVVLCRDQGGLFAMSSVCTHAGCTVQLAGAGFACPCHGSRFAYDGTVTQGPAARALVHFSLCLDVQGDAFVDPMTVVPADQRV